MELSIIVPAHNEERRIDPMLDAYLPFFAQRYADQVEFIVVINGTTDGTESVVAAREKDYPQLRHIVEPKPIGKGGAVLRGVREARGELIGFVDADGASPPEAFLRLVDGIGDADCATASRWLPGSTVSDRHCPFRRLASHIFFTVAHALFALPVHDTQCGAKLFRRAPLLSILPAITARHWVFDVDLLYQLKRTQATIRELPTGWNDVGRSKVKLSRTAIDMALELLRLRLRHSPLPIAVKRKAPCNAS